MVASHSSRWADVRTQFPGTAAGPYIDVAGRSLFFEGGRAALNAHLDTLTAGTVNKLALFETVEETRRLFASLIRCTPDEVAFTRNVTDGIAAFAAGIEWKEGDNVVLCEELEHPANVYPWFGLGRKFGLRVKTVAPEGGALSVERIVSAIDASTRVVTISSVSFAPGFRFPVAELGAECRRRGVLLVVDAAQSIGVVDTNVVAWQADAVAASTQKGLMSLYGLGFLYVRREVAEFLKPTYLSRFGVELDGHEAQVGDPISAAYGVGARRFDVGNYNFPAVITVAPALRLLLDLGPQEVQSYVFDLARKFTNRILDLGLPVFGGPPGAHSSHIVTVGADISDNNDVVGNLDMSSLYQHLVANGVRLSIRRNLLRFSFHIYNNESDIDVVTALMTEWVKRRAHGAAGTANR
ncbi:aminotransferase class V-fold PLP-dependent enzyme [Paraburkholderia sediminicola]|uniref:aminotransferase class V-fold PLP-dependent enzyme n=1 Tax=Paraburkholderia sediminicola TaxID=458836 RepID=UPI0038B6C792